MIGEYSAKEVVVLVNGVPIRGSGEDAFVTVEYDEQDWEKVYGARGQVTRSRNLADGGTITLTLNQTQRGDIAYLEGLAKVDRATGLGVVTIKVTDIRNGESIIGAECWLQQRPSREFAANAGDREYVYDVAEITDIG